MKVALVNWWNLIQLNESLPIPPMSKPVIMWLDGLVKSKALPIPTV
jgi:hypothetical protein